MVASVVGAAAAESTETFTVVSGLPPGHPAVTVFREHFRAAVEERMAAIEDPPTVEWRPAYDGTIARAGEVLEAISDGVGEIGIVAVDREPKRLPLQRISFHLPFVTTQCDIAADAYHSLHVQNADMNKPWQKSGQIYLANITTDGYGLFSGKKIKSIDDLEGLTLAVGIRIESWLSGVAAEPVRLPLGQLEGSFEAEAIHGAILPITELAELKLERVLNNYLLTEFGPQTTYAVTINEARFAGLSAAAREALLAAADQFVSIGAQAYCEAGSSVLAELQEGGLQTQRFFRSRREQWVTALPPLGRLWASAREAEGYAGGEILTAYMDRIRAAGGKPKRDWDLDPAPIN